MLRVLTLATLFPDASRPTFGCFVEQQTLALAARDDVEVQVVAPIGIGPWPLNRLARYRRFEAVPLEETWKGLRVRRPRFVQLPLTGARLSPGLMGLKLAHMLRAIRSDFPFDVVDAEFFYPDGPAATAIARMSGVPCSIKARGADINYWGRRRGCGDQIRAAARRADGLLAVSAALKRAMGALGLPEDKITVHYTGVDRSRFHPIDRPAARRELGVTGPLIVSVGALIPRKGQAFAVDALTDIPGAVLILVGEGEDRAALERRAARRGLGDRVRLPGNLPRDEVARLLAAADVMVLPSESEGLANAWIEALACGTPIVVTDAGGAREVVDRPEAGAIVERNAAAIAAAVNAILADPPDQAAVAATVERFSWERNSETLFAHLSALVERHERGDDPAALAAQ